MARWIVLQLADAAFPAGGFAHSSGLEAAARLGELRDLDAFVDASLWQAGHASIPYVGAAWDASERIAELDAMCDALLVSHVANRASRAQGRGLASACARIFDLRAIDDACRARELRVHLAPAFGAIARALDLTRDEALEVHLHGTLRGIVSAAIRLNLIGPHEAQRATRERAKLLDRVLATCANIPAEHAAQCAPLVDLFGTAHDRLDVRLFVS